MSETGWVHTVAALVALASGGAVLVARKGTRRHQRLGHLYVWSLVLVNGTSFLLTGLFGRFGPFHALALVSLGTLAAGVLPAVLRRPQGSWVEYHARFMAWSYAGLVAAAAAEVAARVPGVPFVGGVLGATGAVVVTAWVLIHGGSERLIRGAVRGALIRRAAGAAVVAVGAGLLAGAAPAAAQAGAVSSHRDQGLARLATALDGAVLGGDAAGARAVRERLEAEASRAATALVLHHLGYALYREAELRQGGDPAERAALRARARTALERSAELQPLGETYGLLANLTGMEMGASPLRAVFLARRWTAELERAAELGPGNPRVELLAGIARFHAPDAFGGGLERTRAHLLRAIEGFAADTVRPPLPAWGHAEAWLWLGRVHERADLPADAAEAYRRALSIAPSYAWAERLLRRVQGDDVPGSAS